MIPGIMKDILELVSVLSLPDGVGQLVGVAYSACLAGVPHHPKCLARSIHDSWGCKKTSRNLFRSFRYPANLGQFSSPDYVTLAGGPHHPKCLRLQIFRFQSWPRPFLGPSHRPHNHTYHQIPSRLSFPGFWCVFSKVQ